MDTKTREALLRTDLSAILRSFVRLDTPDNLTETLNDLPCSVVCRRYCGLCFVVTSLKWAIPAPFDSLLSLTAYENDSTIVSSLQKLPLSNPAFRLGILGGIIEAQTHPMLPATLKASVCLPEVRLAQLRNVEHFLRHASTPSVTVEAIALLNKCIENASVNGQYEFSETEGAILKSALLCALTHCDDAEQSVIDIVSRLFDNVFALLFDNGRVLNSLSDWLLTNVVQEAVIGSPYCLHEAVILTKGPLRLLKCLLKHANLTWILEQSPHLMTSLILAFAWNYTAAYAGDLVNCILSRWYVRPLQYKPKVDLFSPASPFCGRFLAACVQSVVL
ncbi:unnamed protein product [Dibothriocephalus latus]|uniref:Uncharacterized protein n=1 Tax=Dibothriocephalus latus TaxID=60516 RepID=A0A3P7LYK3_DIBLA|nr:unnamed protein product [Dibothriocephalus latus]